ncbi:hypothetical protein H681_12430 [Pseudomonas sp. ATCC 13867]|uniref:hypothetical protein n=1 Tax=Pseudomonas sp. ATCC 13867 TaxID=1294143 RepID=UPI0002C4DE8F|nr:hypothetical protein [Pseudomonas sp. ATCC 13867]AGI24356.1 hypothetical protein H681_12430 [Pseudomonas sp. ATCC 13867]RFQ17723.1 hypothetical protein D0N87_25975 [Pseudomonas sp. ATCC 13867]
MGKLTNDATKLLEAISYQLIVTLEYCHNLIEGQALWLEVYGDVTVGGKAQIEVKNFVDDLTDGHINFWNTLKNWTSSKFKQEKYCELILLTTQAYGATAELRHWNQLTVGDRLALLDNVLKHSEARTAASGKKESKVVQIQQFVMAEERREILLDVIGKVRIVSDEPSLVVRAEEAKSRYGKGLDPSKRGDYFEALLGYLIEPCISKDGWKITYDDFDIKIATLFARYCKNSRKFPVVDLTSLKGLVDESAYADRLFVKKLHEIKYAEKIPAAILEHMVAVQTISSEFKRFTVEKLDVDSYKNDQLKRHISLRSGAIKQCRRLSKEYWCEESQIFFDNRCGEPVDGMPAFDGTTVDFRNGIWHMLADDEDEEGNERLHWRLW